MNKQIKALFQSDESSLNINKFCTLRYFFKDALGDDNQGKGHLIADFTCFYGKAWHSTPIESRDPNEIKEIIKKEQTYFFDDLRDMLNRQIDGGYIG